MRSARRFFFRGEAIGLAGHIRRPGDFVIPTQASASLPVIGGSEVSAVNGGSWSAGGSLGWVVSFRSAIVTVSGDYQPAEVNGVMKHPVQYTFGNHHENALPAVTEVTTEIRELRIAVGGDPDGHEVTVARLASTLKSTNTRSGSSEPAFDATLQIERLAIDDRVVKPDLEPEVVNARTFSDVVRARGRHSDLFEEASSMPGDYAVLTACRSVTDTYQREQVGPNRIYVEGFGTIYLAEMVVSRVERRLAMLRIELGSPTGGDIQAGGLIINGHNWPP